MMAPLKQRVSNVVQSRNVRGILWMIASMALFSLEDTLIKQLSRDMPLGEVLTAFGLAGAFVFFVLLQHAGLAVFRPEVLSLAMIVRALCELVGRLFYFLAIALTPLSSATVILQATPVLVVLGAHVYFGETISWRRWLAIVLGLLGVLIVLRPNSSEFSLLSLLAVLGMLGFVGRDLASRAAPGALHVNHLGFYGFLTVALAGIFYSIFDNRGYVLPTGKMFALFLFAIPVGLGAYITLMKAMRTGDVGAVTPFRYTRLIFGVSLGVFVFGEVITLPIIIGCCVILASGLLISHDALGVRKAS